MTKTNKCKVLMIAVQHSAKDDRIFYKEARSLKNEGYKVSCLILTDIDGNLKDMSGNILNKNNEESIEIEGIEMTRILPPLSKKDIFLKKIFMGNFQKMFLKKIISSNASIYHAHEPLSLRFAIKASKRTGKKVIFDSHESWLGGTIKEKFIKLFYLNKVNYLITVNDGIQKLFTNKQKFKLTEVIYNASLTTFFTKNDAINTNQKSPIIVHEGSLFFNRGLINMLNALVLVKKKYPSVVLKIVGSSPKEESLYLKNRIKKDQLEKNIIQTGWVEYEKVPKELKDCSIGLILYNNTINNSYSTSNKLFNYIASGLAIVSVDIPETTKILKPLNNSIIVKDHSPNEIAKSLIILLNDSKLLNLKRQASFDGYKFLNWEVEEKKLFNFYEKVIND